MIKTYNAVTVWQPWASLIAIGAKPYEFRSYPAPQRYVGDRIAIHAGARPMVRQEVYNLIQSINDGDEHGLEPALALSLLEPLFEALGQSGPPALSYSAVVCTARLGTPIPNATLARKRGATRVLDSDRPERSSWAWPLTEIDPVPGPRPYVKGQQGWFFWRDHRCPVSA